MKNPFSSKAAPQKQGNKNALRVGGYSLVVTAVVLAILVMVNIFASMLPTNLTKYDISATKLYSITSNTKVVLNNLQDDVTIYWIVQSDQEDAVLENLLAKYESLSDHIDVVKKNPDVHPTFAEQYTDEPVANNSLVVECGDRSRYIALTDIYIGEVNMYSGTYTADSFDGEGAITSAIDYVVNEDFPQLYILEGHGEAALPESYANQIEKENIETNTLSLLTVDSIPEEADAVLIHAPESDISEDEKKLLANYVKDGGKLWVAAGPVADDELSNLYSLLVDYGIERVEGVVVEGDQQHHAFGTPQLLLPDLNTHAITDPLIEENYYAVIPSAQGLIVPETSANATVTPLMSTSPFAYSKAIGSTYEREESDPAGPFALAVSVEHNSGGQMVWFTSSYFLEDQFNAFSSGSNGDMAMNALSMLIGESEAMAIRTKSLNYNYLTIDESTASMLQVVMIGVFPLIYLGIGIAIIIRRKGKQNEPI